MNSSTILQTHLLDIIFENRNKDYGAYQLRKFYNKRLSLALFIMVCFVLFFCGINYFFHPLKDSLDKQVAFESREYEPSSFTFEIKKPIQSTIHHAKKKTTSGQQTTPEIVADKNINKSVASVLPADASQLASGSGQIEFGTGKGVDGKFEAPKENVVIPEKKEKKPEIYLSADVMPQFPGGLKALLQFLKKNIKSPADVEEGAEISVKVRFVVDITGQLQSFKVMESGGEVFDNEVLRVLKKMPKWIPGKSKGENVAVYFIVPVRFTQDW